MYLLILWTCGSPLKLSPAGGLRLPSGKHGGYFNRLLDKSQEKNGFFATNGTNGHGLERQLFVFFKLTLHETSFYKGNFFDHGIQKPCLKAVLNIYNSRQRGMDIKRDYGENLPVFMLLFCIRRSMLIVMDPSSSRTSTRQAIS